LVISIGSLPDGAGWAGMGEINPDLLALLVCPETHAPLVEHEGWLYSTDGRSRRKYPIREGIPILLVPESRIAEPEEFEAVMKASKKAVPVDAVNEVGHSR